MNIGRTFARAWGTGVILVAAAGAAHALACMNPGDLNVALAELSSGNTLSVTGTCVSNDSPFTITASNVTVNGNSESGVLKDQLLIEGSNVTVEGFISNGSSTASGANVAIVVAPGASAIITGTSINTWSGEGIVVEPGGSAAIAGGVITSITGAGIHVLSGAAATIGYVPLTGTTTAVEDTTNGNGIIIENGGAALIADPDIFENHQNGIELMSGAVAEIVAGSSGVIEDNQTNGILMENGSTLVFNSTALGGSSASVNITQNTDAGISMFGGTLVIDTANITGNDQDGLDASAGASVTVNGGTISSNFGGGINAIDSMVKLRSVALNGNTAAPAIEAVNSVLDVGGATIGPPESLGQPGVQIYSTKFEFLASTLNGPANAPSIAAAGGSSVLLQGDTIEAPLSTSGEATIEAIDGSNVVSVGGNTLKNTTTGGDVLIVANASTFHQESGPLFSHAFTAAADALTGGALVQVQSNMEIGTGGTVPSTWTTGSANIQVQQNSSFRMDGGMSITGAVTVQQGSNAFFNVGLGGTNTISSGLTCPFTTLAASHVAAPTKVTPNVVTSSSPTSPQCLPF